MGVEVYRNTTWLCLTQTKYVIDLLINFGYKNLKPSLTPMAVGKLSLRLKAMSWKIQLYRSAIGVLQYLAHKRRDITYFVNRMSQFLQTLTNSH